MTNNNNETEILKALEHISHQLDTLIGATAAVAAYRTPIATGSFMRERGYHYESGKLPRPIPRKR